MAKTDPTPVEPVEPDVLAEPAFDEKAAEEAEKAEQKELDRLVKDARKRA